MIADSISRIIAPYQAGMVRTAPRPSRAEEARDIIAFSSAAKDYLKVREAICGSPDTRADKVREFKKRYNAGAYDVSGEDIAAKILGI